jgi:drug/metabolite transporter (DMT)-like permease
MNVGIFSLFHIFPKYQIDTFQAIVFNYITCVITGLVFIGSIKPVLIIEIQPWTPIAFIIGGIFIGAFYLIALTTQRYGISVASIATKMSMAIPVIFALFIFDIESKEFNFWNYLGLFSALIAIYLSAYRSEEIQTKKPVNKFSWLLLPLVVFLIAGIIDTTINYANYRYLTSAEAPIFPIYIFISASVIGITTMVFAKKKIKLVNIIGGFLLGVINYFSVYFLLLALTAFQNDGAVVYPLLNLLIIMGSVLVSVILFNEKLKLINKIGLILSLFSIFLISHQELINFISK